MDGNEGISLGMTLERKTQTSFGVCGGMTESVFPEVEAWLMADSKRQRALEFVARRKNMYRY